MIRKEKCADALLCALAFFLCLVGTPGTASSAAPEFRYDATAGQMVVINNGHYLA